MFAVVLRFGTICMTETGIDRRTDGRGREDAALQPKITHTPDASTESAKPVIVVMMRRQEGKRNSPNGHHSK
jgi:hypothetical protein